MSTALKPKLVERLLVYADPLMGPEDETITETTGETDLWTLEYPPGSDTITKNDGESDTWKMANGSGPDDTITRADGETDSWTMCATVAPRPQPPDDIITLDDGEGDSWS